MSLKMYTLSFLFCWATLQIIAQPVLTTESQTPQIGETYEVQFADVFVFEPGPGGADQTWDFSELNLPFTELQFSILEPGDGLSAADFPDADFVWRLDEFQAYNYYQVSETGLDLVGGASGTADNILFLEIFSDSEDGLHYPATYADSYTYFSAFTAHFFGMTSYNERNGEVEYDGYGTLILPDGTTYENVLRMIIRSETTAFPIIETQYAWMLPGQFIPLMVYTSDDDDESSPSIYYSKKNSTTATSSPANVDLGLRLQQNPVKDQLQFQGTTEMLHNATIHLWSSSGQRLDHKLTSSVIDVTHLPAGTYYLTVSTTHGQQVLPFVKG